MHPSLVAVLRGGIGLDRSPSRFSINMGLVAERSISALFGVPIWECAHTMVVVAMVVATRIAVGCSRASENGGVVDKVV